MDFRLPAVTTCPGPHRVARGGPARRDRRRAAADGSRLPATRVLAQELGFSRGVVVEAYQRLTDEGLLSGRTGAGTRVTAPASRAWHRPERRRPPGLRLPWRPAAGWSSTCHPGCRICRRSRAPRGCGRSGPCSAETTGADLGLRRPAGQSAAACRAGGLAGPAPWRTGHRRRHPRRERRRPGARAALPGPARAGHRPWRMEDPGSRGARDQLDHWGLQPVPCRWTGTGCGSPSWPLPELRAVLLTPAHQFPTGVVLSPGGGAPCWSGPGWSSRTTTTPSTATTGRPSPRCRRPRRTGWRTAGACPSRWHPGCGSGWLVAPRELQADLVAAKHGSDLGNPALAQLVLARLLATGELRPAPAPVRRRQRRRRDALVAALREHVPAARVEGVAAGLHVLVTLPGGRDDAELAARIRARAYACSRCPGTGSDRARRVSSSGMRHSRPTACWKRSAGSALNSTGAGRRPARRSVPARRAANAGSARTRPAPSRRQSSAPTAKAALTRARRPTRLIAAACSPGRGR